MELNKIYHGFKLVSKKELKELGTTFYHFVYEQTKTELIYLANDDTNKCFNIGFRTLPEDSTGICHIIEHSVLCGSKKYPVKEPFVNLIKGSMASFLNAMTASDCTLYPIASPNDKDFNNLMSVYLDAVFAPLSVLDPKPFLQEGWHLELLNEGDMPSYKGIVYNEMKGAMSDPLSQISEYTNQVLYKGTCYEYNSGGDPECIPNLTYEYYKKFYHKHYHPTNSVIYLYGEMDILEKLKFISDEYLSKFNVSNEVIEFSPLTPIIDKDVVRTYEIGDEEELENNSYISLSFVLDMSKNVRDALGFSLLNEALMGTNAAPLKKVLIENDLAEDIDSYFDDNSLYPSYSITLSKTTEEKKELFFNLVMSELKRLADEGIDKELLLSTININEFKNKELDTGRMPKGLLFAFSIMQGFNYDIPYLELLETSQYYKFFKENLDNGYFEELIRKYILNCNHYAMVTMNPSKELKYQKIEEMKQKMEEIKNSMTSEEISECIKVTNELIAYQEKRDDIEDLKKLPDLKLTDIPTTISKTPTKETLENGYRFIEHEVSTNKIGYMRLYFDLSGLDVNELAYARVLARILVKLDTKKYTVDKLQSYIKTYLGNIGFSPVVNAINKEEYIAKMLVTVSSLEENISHISKVLNEVINNSIFDLEKIKTILVQMKNRERSTIIENGTAAATTIIRSQLSKEGALSAKMSGLNMYNFLNEIINNIDEEFITKLKEVSAKIFNSSNLITSISGDNHTLELLKEATYQLQLPNSEIEKCLKVGYQSEIIDALVVPSGVNCNVKGINLNSLGFQVNGSLYVLQHIINYDYLWPEVRVKGGAYGCSLSLSISDDIIFGSFSDPNVINTYEVYDKTADYLLNFNPSEEEFISYLIGTVAKIDPPASTYSKIAGADKNHLCNLSIERLERLKKEILETTVEDIKAYSTLFKKIAQLSILCTVGNEVKINEYDRFENVKKLV